MNTISTDNDCEPKPPSENKEGLAQLLANWKPLEEGLPEIEDLPENDKSIFD